MLVLRVLRRSLRVNAVRPVSYFGFEEVSDDEKQARVQHVFSSVARNYNLMNDVMSAGIHRLWKDHFVRCLAPTPDTTVLDVAGGTGDIAFRVLRYQQMQKNSLKRTSSLSRGSIIVCDINSDMLKVGAKLAAYKDDNSSILWVCGDAEDLPVGSNSVDAYTIAFGIRNVTHIDKALQEAYRVLKPGGCFLCLEFSQIQNAVLERMYDTYSFEAIPILGELFARDRESYEYLVQSIRLFPPQDEFSNMIEDAGFSCVKYENLSLGIAAIHSGFKLKPLAN